MFHSRGVRALRSLLTAALVLGQLTSGAAIYKRANISAFCPDYTDYAQQPHAPYSHGPNKLPFQRPSPACRTFNSSVVENTINKFQHIIRDNDLFWLFRNTFPNTLDTTIKWRGYSANDSTQELAFLVTGDIDAMWIRDSSNQIHAYAPLLQPSNDPDSLASLFRGTINLQARFISQQPWCNSYQPPPESGIGTQYRGDAYTFTPDTIDMNYCFTPNFELDSYGAFFQVSHDYYSRTRDTAFFGKYNWIAAVKEILRVSKLQMAGFYNNQTGEPLVPAYTFNSQTTTSGGTLDLNGVGAPVRYTGMVKAPFGPSDNSNIYEFMIPSNIMFAGYLDVGAEIMERLRNPSTRSLAAEMRSMSQTIRAAIQKYGVVPNPNDSSKQIYAFSVDGYGGRSLMDDANTPSLLSIPLQQYIPSPRSAEASIYQNTREWLLSLDDPWWSQGPLISGVGSPHTGTGKPWPMALITRIQTTNDDREILSQLQQLVNSTAGLGLMHESINSRNTTDWTRQWFAWCNSLFGEMILDLNERKPYLLSRNLY
ncbi:hypothetical protein PRZ48_002482 [Zasmidium cellare]|uniref:Glycoside hydrolase family 125 protein n=1 Tax=Zasmidium cellare TaxID=395010 RepID=A0ABR0F5R8_ZASCE|nr:hypothetical protein PRZ48_002482 [Zasmidium cellare]